MTSDEVESLIPGSIIRSRHGRREPRLVIAVGRAPRTGRTRIIGLVKIGHSWTDPRPTAWYDHWEVCRSFDFTGRIGCTPKRALAIRNWEPEGHIFGRFRRKR